MAGLPPVNGINHPAPRTVVRDANSLEQAPGDNSVVQAIDDAAALAEAGGLLDYGEDIVNPATPTTTPAAPAAPAAAAPAAASATDETIAELRAELEEQGRLTQALIAGQRRVPAAPAPFATPAPTQSLEERIAAKFGPDDASRTARLQASPMATIIAISADVAREIAAEAASGVRKEVRTETAAQAETSRRFNQGVEATKAEFPMVVKGHPSYNAEFDKEAAVECRRMIDERGFQDPDDFYNASARTEARWLRAGKNPRPAAREQAQSNGGPTRTERIREIARSTDFVGSNGADNNGGGGKEPTRLEEIGYTPAQARAARAVAKRSGLSEADYIRNIRSLQSVNPDYGRG